MTRLAEHSRRVREAKKLKWNDGGSTDAFVKQSLSNSRAKLTPSSFSLAQILSRIAAGKDWIVEKVVKESETSDPGSHVMNFVKFTESC